MLVLESQGRYLWAAAQEHRTAKYEIGAYAAAVRRVKPEKRARFAANVETVEQPVWKERKRTAGKLKIHR